MLANFDLKLMRSFLIMCLCLLVSAAASGQSATATLSGAVVDEKGAFIANARVTLVNAGTKARRQMTTGDDGRFVFPLLAPGAYTLTVESQGFAPVEFKSIVLNVNDQRVLNIQLKIGQLSEVVIVETDTSIQESPSVGTVIDRQFVGNLPLNARSLHSLITLVPGVVRAPGAGQFSVNGQRSNANYFTLDGVSANISARADIGNPAQHYSGTVPGQTVFGGTNNLISIDALQEFRIQTSTFAPEFGRTPGGQVSLVSRSGANEFHGALFEYFRNDAMDANDWFANRGGLPKPPLRQNQFGGALGGPVLIPGLYNGKDRMFFFASYEGLRLRQPQTAVTFVPALRLRQDAPPAVQTLLNAFPLPTGPEVVDPEFGPTGEAPLTAVYSDPTSMNATSFRIDHVFSSRFNVFGRYNQAPSRRESRSPFSPSLISDGLNDTRTVTLGATFSLTPRLYNEFRANYSHVREVSASELDDFGGAVPFTLSQVLPPVLAPDQRGGFGVDLFLPGSAPSLTIQSGQINLQRQFNLVDNLYYATSRHQLKFGIDYRRLAPRNGPIDYFSGVFFCSEFEIFSSTPCFTTIQATDVTRPIFTNFSAYAQDTWNVNGRLTLTYGARWEVNPAPTEANGKQPFIVRGLDDLATATVELLPPGERLWKTRYGNFAPRVGVAYQLAKRQGWETALRGGFGLFYDLGTGPAASALLAEAMGRSPFAILIEEPYPLSPEKAAPPAPGQLTAVAAFDPNLELPFSYQWNVAVEQSLGGKQSLTMSYVAAVGRRLLETRSLFAPIPSLTDLLRMGLVRNGATSDYHALQVQFQRQLSRGLQALASYSWSHAIDDLSDEFNFDDVQPLRGDADFDLRHVFSAALTYDVPSPFRGGPGKAVLGNWAIDSIIRSQSAYPFTPLADPIILPDGTIRLPSPNLVPGAPIYLNDVNAPGGRRVNPAAFQAPPEGEQGDAGRNRLRGLALHQVDLALRRTFPVGERLKLVFRAEAFNFFNHPNFERPDRILSSPLFGEATQMFNRSFGGLSGGSIRSPLYEIGGPRSMQLALRLEF